VRLKIDFLYFLFTHKPMDATPHTAPNPDYAKYGAVLKKRGASEFVQLSPEDFDELRAKADAFDALNRAFRTIKTLFPNKFTPESINAAKIEEELAYFLYIRMECAILEGLPFSRTYPVEQINCICKREEKSGVIFITVPWEHISPAHLYVKPAKSVLFEIVLNCVLTDPNILCAYISRPLEELGFHALVLLKITQIKGVPIPDAPLHVVRHFNEIFAPLSASTQILTGTLKHIDARCQALAHKSLEPMEIIDFLAMPDAHIDKPAFYTHILEFIRHYSPETLSRTLKTFKERSLAATSNVEELKTLMRMRFMDRYTFMCGD
jgi:hypothetical protein